MSKIIKRSEEIRAMLSEEIVVLLRGAGVKGWSNVNTKIARANILVNHEFESEISKFIAKGLEVKKSYQIQKDKEEMDYIEKNTKELYKDKTYILSVLTEKTGKKHFTLEKSTMRGIYISMNRRFSQKIPTFSINSPSFTLESLEDIKEFQEATKYHILLKGKFEKLIDKELEVKKEVKKATK